MPNSSDSHDRSIVRTILRRVLIQGLVFSGATTLVQPVAAHGGNLHAGMPHWILLGVALIGIGVIGLSLWLGRTRWEDQPRRTIMSMLVGSIITMIGTLGVTQIQIEPIGTTPTAHAWYPLLAGITGLTVLTVSLVGGGLRWPRRPRYPLLGLLLGAWILYPVMMPNGGYTQPLGYALVVTVPVVVGYIIWRDVSPALSTEILDQFSRRVGGVVAALFAVFFLFSAGLFTVNPDTGANAPTEAFVTSASFLNPLVVWPAVEIYLPSVPLSGAISVGTALVIGLLAILIGINTGLMVTIYQRNIETTPAGSAAGVVATSGATACCCCGPAVYAIASALLGISATPLYWAFIDPASPLGSLFFTGAVLLLTGSTVRLVKSLNEAGVCEIPAASSTTPRRLRQG